MESEEIFTRVLDECIGDITGQSLPIFIQLVLSLRISARILVSRLASLIEAIARMTVWKRAAEHLHDMLGGEQGVDEAIEACAQRREARFWVGEPDA